MTKFFQVIPILLGLILAGCGESLTSAQITDICNSRLLASGTQSTQNPLPFVSQVIPDGEVAYSPSNGEVAFQNSHRLYVASTDGKGLTAIASGDGFYDIVWSTDGQLVSYARTNAKYVYVKRPNPGADEMYIKTCTK